MSQSPQSAAPSITLSDPTTDPLLALVLDGFDSVCCTAGLTLTVGSLIVCGNTASETDYFPWLANEARTAQAAVADQAATQFADNPRLELGLAAMADAGERLAQKIERSGEATRAHRTRRTAQKGDGPSAKPAEPRQFITLSDVVLWTPAGSLARLAYWRAPLSAVTGWSIGRIDPEPIEPPADVTASPSPLAGGGAPDAVTVLTQFARGFVDAYRAERERQKGERPDGIDPAGVSDFAKEWARKMEQGRRGDAFADEFTDELERPSAGTCPAVTRSCTSGPHPHAAGTGSTLST